MNNIYEAVRSAIKSKLPAEREVDGQIVETNRDEILESVPFHVKRAITKLQEDDVIPPRMYSIKAGDAKHTYVDKSGEEVFSYMKLPDKFLGLDNFQVENRNLDWSFHDNEFMIEKMSKLRGKPLYKVFKLDITESGDFQDVLVLAPFPEDNEMVYVKHYIDATEEFIGLVDDNYTNAIISRIEQMLGLGSKIQADEDAFDASEKWDDKTRRGDQATTKPRYFGRTTPRRRKRRSNI